MQFNSKAVGGALTGAYLTASSTDSNDPMATALGAAIGGFTGNSLDFSLPRGTTSPINTRVDLARSFNNQKDYRASMLNEINQVLNERSVNSSFDGDFSFTNPLSTINSKNVGNVLDQYNNMSNMDLQRSYLNFKNNRNVYTSLQDPMGRFSLNAFKPDRIMLSEVASLQDKQTAMYNYLTNISGETDAFAKQRVQEFTPFLNRLNSDVMFSNGNLSTKAFGENLNIALTQTLGDGVTTGYISNNNVYLANQYNIVGGLIAERQGIDSDASFNTVAKSLGLEGDSTARETLAKMLRETKGMSKEATLGMLASMGVSDEAMSSAIESFEANKQWDEYSTSEHLKRRIAQLNGTSYERQVSEYAKSISNLVDFSKTVNYSDGATAIMERDGDALRNLKASANEKGAPSELAKLRRVISGEGGDMFSNVKADANTKLASLDYKPGSPTMFLPYGRSPLTVGRRALPAPTIDSNRKTLLDSSFDSFKRTFNSESILDSSVALRSRTFDMDLVGDTFSKLLGGNITLADGLSIGNSNTLSRFSAEGVRKVSVPSDAYNNVALKNPLLSKLINNELNLDTARLRAGGAEHLVRFNTSRNQEKVFAEMLSGLKAIDKASDYSGAITGLLDNTSEIFDGQVNKMMDDVDAFKKKFNYTDTDSFIKTKLKDSYLDLMSEKLKMQRKGIDRLSTNAYASETIHGYNSEISDVINNLKRGSYDDAQTAFEGAVSGFNNRRRDALDSSRLINAKSNTIVGYDLDGLPIKLPESYSKYNLLGVMTSVDKSGKGTLDLLYGGRLGLEENYSGKGFGINSKEQIVMARGNDIGIAGVYGTMLEKNMVSDTGTGIQVSGRVTASGKDTLLSYADFNKSLTSGSVYDTNTTNLINRTYADFARNVDVISDVGGTGFKAEREIFKGLKSKSTTSEYVNPAIWDSLRNYQDANNVGKKGLQGLVNFSLATSNEKASLATLASVFTANEERFNKLSRDYGFNKISDKQAINQFRKINPNFSPSISPTNKETRVQVLREMEASLSKMHSDFSQRFSDRSSVYNMLENTNHRNSAIDFFVRSSRFTSDTVKNRVNIASLNRTAISETGAGTVGKSMSWNAQLQLLGNGFSYDDLDTFAKFDKGSYNDLNAITGMIKNHENSLNQYFDYSKNTQFKNAFNASPEDRRDMFKKLGISTGNDVDFYNLSYSPEGSVKSVPIMYDESRLFDSYTSTKTGEQTNRSVTGLMYEIIQSDMELQATADESVKDGIRKQLDTLHSKLQGRIRPALSGSTSAAKAALTREGSSSMQATVGAINGEMSDFLRAEGEANRHTSYVAVSQEGAMKRLSLAGVDLEGLEQLNQKHLERIGNTSLYKLKLEDGSPFFGVVNREPATGPLSARLSEYVVDMSIKNSRGAKDSIFVKSEDPLYKLFQFGDYDFDNMSEYFMEDMQKVDAEKRAAILAKGRTVALEYGQLQKFADKLGVKNNKSKQLSSLFDIYEKNKANIKSEADWHNYYADYLESTTKQAGLRKVVSPQVTMLSAALNNSLMRSSDSDKGIQAARVLTHYFVENLLKAQHASNEGGTINTEAEDLANARKAALNSKGTAKQYLEDLEKSLTNMISGHKKDSEEYSTGLDAIKKIVSAESQYMTDRPVNSMELGIAGVGKQFNQQISNIASMINGEEQAIPLFRRTENIDIDVAKTARVGYDRFKNITNQFLERNKKALAIGAIGLGGVAVAFQSKPHAPVTADVGRQTLAPAATNDQESSRSMTVGRDFNKSPEYITPHRDARRAVSIEGQYIGNSSDYQDNSRQSIFGDSIDSAQVEYRE